MKKTLLGLSCLLLLSLSSSCGDNGDAPTPPPITISGTTVSGFEISWDDSQPIIVQASESEQFTTIAYDSTFSSSPATVVGLKSMQDYHIRYAYTNAPTTFSESQNVSTNALTVPVGLSTSQIFGDSFKLTWTAISGANYSLDVATDLDFTALVDGYDGLLVTDNQVRIEVPDILTTYYYRLKSVNGNQSSDYSATGNVTTTDVLLFTFFSPAFGNGEVIPNRFACQGPSTPLVWKNLPSGTRSVAIIMDDLDFPGRVYNHWVIYNIPVNFTELAEAVSGNNIPPGSTEGLNDLGQARYFGPCPPAGVRHRYEFKLYALNIMLDLDGLPRKGQVLSAMNGHIVGQKTITGLYN